jgi:hypothetical protein
MLRSGGVALALPWLEIMVPRVVHGQAAISRPRFIGFYQPNGVNGEKWKPALTGPDYQLSPTLEPLGKVRSKVTVLSNLRLADANYTHQTFATMLSGYRPKHPDLAKVTSFDQVVARGAGFATPFESLQLMVLPGLESAATPENAHEVDCKIDASTMSGRDGTPLPTMCNPRKVFDRLFSVAPTDGIDQRAVRSSVLDAVRERTIALKEQLGAADRRRLDEYLDGIRSIELTLNAAVSCDSPLGSEGVPTNRESYVRLMLDLAVIALKCELTRVITFHMGVNNSESVFEFDGKKYLHHSELSHHGQDPLKLDLVHRVEKWHVGHFAYLLEQLDATQEAERTALDNTVAYYTSEIGDGQAHNAFHVPALLAGRGGGALKPGQHLAFPFTQQGTAPPTAGYFTADVLLTLLNRVYGIDQASFGEFGASLIDELTV